MVRRLLTRVVYEIGTVAGRLPVVALPVARRLGHGQPLGADTEVVIEGFPRSANSLAVAALTAAQPSGIRVAHHVHAPAHVIAAVRRGLPTVVLIREPEEAVVELVATKPSLTVGQALRGYLRFYEPLLPYRDRFVVARSSEVAADVGRVIRKVNQRFRTSFAPPTAEAEEVAGAIERYWRDRSGPGLPLVGRTARVASEGLRVHLHRLYRAPRLGALRARAERVHAVLTERADDLGLRREGAL